MPGPGCQLQRGTDVFTLASLRCVTVMAFSRHTTLGPKWVFPKRGLFYKVAPAISHYFSYASVLVDISLSCLISLQEITTTRNMNYNFNYIVK